MANSEYLKSYHFLLIGWVVCVFVFVELTVFDKNFLKIKRPALFSLFYGQALRPVHVVSAAELNIDARVLVFCLDH